MSGTRPRLVLVGGPTCSGKSTLVRLVAERLGQDLCTVLTQDDFYHDLSALPLEERAQQNFDRPGSIDSIALIRCVKRLIRGEPVQVPVYDFTTHTRMGETREALPRPYLFVEGTLVLHWSALRSRAAIRAFLDTPSEACFQRRLSRDTAHRGRTEASVLEQWRQTVWPMHRRYVLPTRRHADVLLDGRNIEAAAECLTKLLTGRDAS